MSEKTTAESIVAKLAEWSKKYPRGMVYPMSKISMDNELIEIENLAKRYAPSPALQDAVKEIVHCVHRRGTDDYGNCLSCHKHLGYVRKAQFGTSE
jgi:hypothetical protein